ncbi:MAG: chromate efflux transporter [Magnetococcales bacterium]|nr:chromate efflux transporter [Magnetococcales bacterium]
MTNQPEKAPSTNQPSGGAWQVFQAFLQLGLTSFGGPVAHIGYFQEAFVVRRRWLSATAFADLVALSQFLPGPASSQVGIGLGAARAGVPGAIAAWLGFTLPSALLMILFGYGVFLLDANHRIDWLHGLKLASVAVVAQAVWAMAKSLCPDRNRATLALVSAMVVLVLPPIWGQMAAILGGALMGWFLLRRVSAGSEGSDQTGAQSAEGEEGSSGIAPVGILARPRNGAWLLGIFFFLLFGAPLINQWLDWEWLHVGEAFFRSGSLIFGGGHVVLPLLQAELAPHGWITGDLFLAGYGAAQAVPGPLLTFSAYLGVVLQAGPGGMLGGLLALMGIFLPSFLLVLGTLPFWEALRTKKGVRSVFDGINSAVVGLLLAALYDPVFTGAILSGLDLAIALGAFILLVLWKQPVLLVVALTGFVGAW